MGVSDNKAQPGSQEPMKSVMIKENIGDVGDDVTSEIIQGSPTRYSHKIRKDFQRSQHHFNPRDRRRKLCGVRMLRRCENLNFLLNQAEKDEDESGEVDFVDLVSHHNSAFQELFMEEEKMSAWLAFADSSEEEQQKILHSASKVKLDDLFQSSDGEVDDESDFENIGFMEGSENQPTGTTGSRCFGLTAHECFLRINRNLRNILRRNRLPVGELRHLEDELVAFFVEWPLSVYVAHLPDGYRRLMLHAVSQYLDLDARSFDVPSAGKRQTHVEYHRGRNKAFVPPPTSLASYVHDNKLAFS